MTLSLMYPRSYPITACRERGGGREGTTSHSLVCLHHPPPTHTHTLLYQCLYSCLLLNVYITLSQLSDCKVNDSVYQSIVEINVKPSFWQLKPNWNWIMQQDSDSKYSSNTYNRMTDREKNFFACLFGNNDTECLSWFWKWDAFNYIFSSLRNETSFEMTEYENVLCGGEWMGEREVTAGK